MFYTKYFLESNARMNGLVVYSSGIGAFYQLVNTP